MSRPEDNPPTEVEPMGGGAAKPEPARAQGAEDTTKDLNTRRAIFVYEAARLAAAAAEAPIVPPPWADREEPFRAQFLGVIERQCGPDRSVLPERLHEEWVEAYRKMGWVYGERRDADAKTHPDMVPYWELGQLERDKDAVFVALCEIARRWIYDPELPPEVASEAIHKTAPPTEVEPMGGGAATPDSTMALGIPQPGSLTRIAGDYITLELMIDALQREIAALRAETEQLRAERDADRRLVKRISDAAGYLAPPIPATLPPLDEAVADLRAARDEAEARERRAHKDFDIARERFDQAEREREALSDANMDLCRRLNAALDAAGITGWDYYDDAIRMLTQQRDEARADARILAHAYTHDSRPPCDVVQRALANAEGEGE